MYNERRNSKKIQHLASIYPAVLVTGPRQSGKTELVRHEFSGHNWVLLDRPTILDQARHDPGLFIKNHPWPVIYDEVQRSKSLFLEIKGIIDENKPDNGSFILTGSQPFLLMQDISESLAGRIGIMELLPMTISELNQDLSYDLDATSVLTSPPIGKKFNLPFPPNEMLLRGFFPAMALTEHSPATSDAVQRLNDYIQTYVTRDLRELSMLKDLAAFEKFLRQLAVHAAQPLNVSEVGSASGIKQSTAQEWLSLVEASFLYKRIPGYHRKFGRRESKRPKGLFIDCGLTAQLLGYKTKEQINVSPLSGRLFESAAINLIMQTLAEGSKVYHWRVDEQREVDLIIEVRPDYLIPVEVKMTSRPQKDDCLGIDFFMKSYPEAKQGIILSLHEECFWLTKDILHVPLAML